MAIKVYASVSGNVLDRSLSKVKSTRLSNLGDSTSATCLLAGVEVSEVVFSNRNPEGYENAHFLLPREYYERLVRRQEAAPPRYVSTLQIEPRYPYCSRNHLSGTNGRFEDLLSTTHCALLALDSNDRLCLSRFDVIVHYRII